MSASATADVHDGKRALRWFDDPADARGDRDWAAVARLRTEVFVEEQSCPWDEEFDRHDASARHALLRIDDAPAATVRWRTVVDDGRETAKLERLAVARAFRGCGLGRTLIAAMIDDARRAGHTRIRLHAQAHLQRLYERHGFVREGDRFDEAGIPHVAMVRSWA
ncbi:MAG: GNAT family N-acetyltransferase [Acidobacteriota bacterium]